MTTIEATRQTNGNSSAQTVAFLREVLSEIARQKVPPTPENFARVYRDVQRARGLPVSTEYVSELSVLDHAIKTFDELFVADAWLGGKLAELRDVLAADELGEDDKRRGAKLLLQEVEARKAELLYHLDQSSGDLKRSVGDVVSEIGRIATTVGGFRTNITRYQALVETIGDVADARRVMARVADDTRKLDQTLSEHEEQVTRSAVKIEEAGAMLMGGVSANRGEATGRMPLAGSSHPVAQGVLSSQELLARLTKLERPEGVLVLVELAEYDPNEARVRQLSDLCETCAKASGSAWLIGYWGGSQFVHVLPGGHANDALNLVRALSSEVILAQAALADPLTFNFGIASNDRISGDGQGFYVAFERAFSEMQSMDALAA